MRIRIAGVLAALVLVTFPLLAADEQLAGFTPESSREQLAAEAKIDASVNADNLRDWMKTISAKPHHLGSPYGKEVAELIASKYREWGFETTIERFDVLFPTPKSRKLQLLSPTRYDAKLVETSVPGDSTSSITKNVLPTYNASSIDGDVTGELVYVNYGVPADYEALAERGIDVKGKIVIARYGGSWRGIKPKVAAEHGAIGCIIYSDPRDDGYFEGDTYPKGSWRPGQGAQRGSVEDMPLYPGDPLTPGVGATKDAKRLDRKDCPVLTKIPVLPISYDDALPLLRAMAGPVAPEEWRGALPITYHLGPGPAKVRLALQFDWKLVPAYDVIAKMRGAERPDEWIIRGNHHDGWVFGASDPTSGQVAMLEEARVVGELAKNGWKPKRTIIYCSWDGEEPGLLGSTEWAEAHADELREHAAVYINSDSSGRGFLFVGGSHGLQPFVNGVSKDMTDPETGVSVQDRYRSWLLVKGGPAMRKAAERGGDLPIYALGSGSDYTPFLQHLGVAALNVGYGGESGGGSYHSVYDSFDHFTRFGDPGFVYGAMQAKTTARMTTRLADADVLPFDFATMVETIGRYAGEVKKLADDMREETERTNKLIRDGRLVAAADPTKTYVAPAPKDPVPHLEFAPLDNAMEKLEASAKRWSKAKASFTGLDPAKQAELDRKMMAVGRSLIRDEGLPGRPWFRHQIYAPGFYTGYGVKTLPGVREAIEQRDWKAANGQIAILAGVLDRFAKAIDDAASVGMASDK